MVQICASERAKPTSDYADVFESAEQAVVVGVLYISSQDLGYKVQKVKQHHILYGELEFQPRTEAVPNGQGEV